MLLVGKGRYPKHLLQKAFQDCSQDHAQPWILCIAEASKWPGNPQ